MNLRVRMVWALTLALLAGLATYIWLRDQQRQVPVVAAAVDIPARARLTPAMLAVVPVHAADRERVLGGAATDPAQVVGAVAAQDIPRGEVIRDDPRWLTRDPGARTPDGRERLSYFLPPEGRAVAVTVDAQALVAGRVRAGDRVDVIFTSRDSSTGGVYAALVLQQVQVLAVDASASQGAGRWDVTLLVTPPQALELSLAKRWGHVDLALAPRQAEPAGDLPPALPSRFLGRAAAPETPRGR